MPRVSKRRRAREWVLRALYAEEITGGGGDQLSELLAHNSPGEVDENFARRLYEQVRQFADCHDAEVSAQLENWDLTRLALIDLLLIRMALAEFDAFPDVPPKVTLNETIELAKRYSGAQAGAFVNGVLDALLKKRVSAGPAPDGSAPRTNGAS